MDQTILRNVNTPVSQPISIGDGLNVTHINGYLWKFTVDDQWKPMNQGDTRTWNLKGDGWIVSDSTLFPNWYFACENMAQCQPAVIKSTTGITYNKPDYVQELS